ncbi:MAG: bifunctional precorrin-2 dehydrogenase/sirohydrochlorin ferrochelatase [Desulfobacterota bacterium]|nr:bifunctional precorrin-2 dehydrogenase/sirohydrochlorin ferrochelatase [Thermodesulfobacteriota bacterium]
MKRKNEQPMSLFGAGHNGTLFPAFFNLRGRRCVVVGAGAVAQRKIARLRACKARIVVVSPHATRRIATLAAQGDLVWHQKPWSMRYLGGAFLVFAATDDHNLNRRIAAACKERGIPVNVADNPALCDFMMPACFKRGQITVAVSTGGASPACAAYLRTVLAATITNQHLTLLKRLTTLRHSLKHTIPATKKRRKILKNQIVSAILSTPDAS